MVTPGMSRGKDEEAVMTKCFGVSACCVVQCTEHLLLMQPQHYLHIYIVCTRVSMFVYESSG
jgi:hypothetical protein